MEPAGINRTHANATKDGEAFSATTISTIAPITNHAEMERPVEILDKAHTPALALPDIQAKIANREYLTNVLMSLASTAELVR